MISTPTSTAAGISVTAASTRSSRPSERRRRKAGAGPASASEIATAAGSDKASAQRADLLLENRPGLVAVFALPLCVKTGAAQGGAEFLRIGLVEGHALLGQLALQAVVELAYVLALLHRRLVEVILDDLLQV